MRKLCILALMAAAACGGGNQSTTPDGQTGPDGPPAGQTYTLTWGPIMVDAGVEDTRCVTVHLDNTVPIKVHQFHNVLGAVSHHYIVYRVTGEPENADPIPCKPFTDTVDATKGSPLMISQTKDDTLTLPDGVAYSFAANQEIRLELHFINTTDQPQMLMATTTFTTMADADFQNEADFLFIGSPDIDILPGTTAEVSAYFPLPAEFAGSSVFAITGHEHQLGTGVKVWTATSASDPGTAVYDPPNFTWSEPPTVQHDPPFQIPNGGGFKFTCTWDNTAPGAVETKFGGGFNDEMCFFWTYYYPSHGAKVCVHTDQAGGHDICCPGDSLCSLIAP